jgi:hypothetical protein
MALPPLFMGAAHVTEIVEAETDAFRVVARPGRSGIVAVEKFVAADEPILFIAFIVKSYFPPRASPEMFAVVLSGLAITVGTPEAVIA